MKLKIGALLLALLIIFSCGFAVMGEEAVSKTETEEAAQETPFEARILNMLNHNCVYNDDFDFVSVMVDNSMITLLDRADEDGYIKRDIVEGFVFNMYGITLKDYAPSFDFPQKDGHLFVIPRGLELFSHEIIKTETDGDYLYVESTLTVEAHDGVGTEYVCYTTLRKTDRSAFGYNIISSVYY